MLTSESFATKIMASPERRKLLPRISTIIHNRHNIWRLKAAKPFAHLHDEAAQRIFSAYNQAQQRGVPVFQNKGALQGGSAQFNLLFTGESARTRPRSAPAL